MLAIGLAELLVIGVIALSLLTGAGVVLFFALRKPKK